MRVDDIGIERERLLDGLLRGRRIHVEQRLGHSDERGNPFVVGRERILKRLRRFRVVVHLQKQLAPARVQRRIVRRLLRRDAIGVVGELKFAERAGRAAKPRVLGRRRARADLDVGDALQQRERFVAAPHHLVEQTQLERRFTVGRCARRAASAALRPRRTGRD